MTTSAANIAGDLLDATDHIDLDVDAIAARVDAVLGDDLYWFPVRHHSPTVARHVKAVIRQRQPKVIFLEAPAESEHLVEHLVDRKTRPPIAIYSCFRGDADGENDECERTAMWYPLLSYSPEYVTMLAAKQIGADVVFIDMPHWAHAGPSEDTRRRDADHLIIESAFYRSIAAAAGYRTWDEAWDTLFEIDRAERDSEAFRRELATFCAAARATSSPKRIANDGTLARERYMRRVMREQLAIRGVAPSDAMVVCGGFHLFMDHDDDFPPPDVPSGNVNVTAVPYSYFRISELSGYAAGNRAPRWYQTCWDIAGEDASESDALTTHVIATLRAARRLGESVSSADAISVTQHARLLAGLRGRAEPILEDVHDALITCCCKGDPDYEGRTLRRAIDEADIGTAIGRVTDNLGRLPIVYDFYEQLDALGLSSLIDDERVMKLDLDNRDHGDAKRSAFLHRMLLLGVEIGGKSGGDESLGGGEIFKEKWRLRWAPTLEPTLVEKSLHGDTIAAATLTVLRERLAEFKHDAARSCATLIEAIHVDLPTLVEHAEQLVGDAIDSDGRFVSLVDALGSLLLLERYATYRTMRRKRLTELIGRCYDRACFALPEVATAPDDQWERVVTSLQGLAEAAMQRDELDRASFTTHVWQAATTATVPFVRGALLGMLAEMRELNPQTLAAELAAFAQSPPDQMVTAGDFLNGVMAVSRSAILLGADAIVRAIDTLLGAAEWEQYLTMLPRLRAAFERLHERQRDTLAEHVAGLHGLTEHAELTHIETSAGAAAIIADVDRRVAEIMKGWDF